MSQQATTPTAAPSRKRVLWIGIAVIGVAAVGIASRVLDIPPSGDNVSGTITPAQRYQSEQKLSTQDVKLADQTVTQLLQNDAVVKLVKDPQFQAMTAYSAVFAAFHGNPKALEALSANAEAVSYTHLRAHETGRNL